MTIVQEKCKTLVLKLRAPDYRCLGLGEVIKPEDDIDKIIEQLGSDLTQSVIVAINSIQTEVKKTRPSENEVDYEVNIQIYKNLLEYVKDLIKELTKVFDESLTTYRFRIEQLWNNLQMSSNQDMMDYYIKEFLQESEKLFADAAQKYLNSYLNIIESSITTINQSNNQ